MRCLPVAAMLAVFALPVQAGALIFPLACTPGEDCFVQQYPDSDEGPGAADPFCGTATYDGHKGTDIRVLSLLDMRGGIDVLAVADGTVLRVRDDMADQLVASEAEAAAVANRECGNGLVLDLGEGREVQYCHLRQNSLVVAPGDVVQAGEKLGLLGASGLAQFPHVHVQVSRDGELLDPTRGTPLADGCDATPDASQTLWDDAAAAVFFAPRTQLVSAGFSDGPIEHDALVVDGPPPAVTVGDEALVAWAWLIDLEQGDIIDLRLEGPDGDISSHQLDPLERAKATFSAFTGKRMTVTPGLYRLRVQVLRDGARVIDESRELGLD